jgi:ribonuclease PH
MRKVTITPNVNMWSLGSVLIEVGNTKVLCNVSLNDNPPSFCQEKEQGWLSAEYSMLPSATNQRTRREVTKGKISGRTAEIQRLIGRALRGVIDLKALEGIGITVDCDVIQADGGTRTASITGACVALDLAFNKLLSQGKLLVNPLKEKVAAISVGLMNEQVVVDMDYAKDSSAQVDLNVVMTESGKLIELQGTAEGAPFTRNDLDIMLSSAQEAIMKLIEYQNEVLK